MAGVRIGQLAEQAGTTVKALRFYERVGLLPAPSRTSGGYREYDASALDRLRFLKAAKAAGLTLGEIAGVLAARERAGPPCAHVTALLDAHAGDLDRRIGELTRLRAEVQRLRDRARTLDPADCGDDATCHVLHG